MSVIATLAQIGLIIFLVGVAVISFASRVPFLAQRGLTFYSVVSGSMEPTIPVGALIYAGQFQVEELQKEDIITFTVADPDAQAVVVTHRIDEVIKEEQTDLDPDGNERSTVQYSFITKGDANAEVDAAPVSVGSILGVYRWHVPYLGQVSLFAQTPLGFGLLVLLPALILIVWEVISLMQHFKREYARKSEAEIAKLKEELLKRQSQSNE